MSSAREVARGKRVMESSDDFVEERTPTRRPRLRLNFAGDGAEEQSRGVGSDSEPGDFELTGCTPEEGSGVSTWRRTRNVFDQVPRFSHREIKELLENAPVGEEIKLTRMPFDRMMYEGMTNIFRGGYSFILVVDKLRKVMVDWRKKKVEVSKLESKVKDLDVKLMAAKEQAHMYRMESSERLRKLFLVETKKSELEETLASTRQYVGQLVDRVESLTKKVNEAHEEYKRSMSIVSSWRSSGRGDLEWLQCGDGDASGSGMGEEDGDGVDGSVDEMVDRNGKSPEI